MDKERPSYYDAEGMVECYVTDAGEVKVVLPSDVWLKPDQARQFGLALVRCADWIAQRS